MLGVEIDRERVERAQAANVDPAIAFRLGGFALPLRADEQPAVIRAMNVLRQYDVAEHAPMLALLRSQLAPGGLLIEGTSSPTGRLLCFHDLPAPGSGAASLVLSVNRRRPWHPRELQAVLPKDLIGRCEPGSPLDRFFRTWERSLPHGFAGAVDALADAGYAVDRTPTLLRHGFLRLRTIPGA